MMGGAKKRYFDDIVDPVLVVVERRRCTHKTKINVGIIRWLQEKPQKSSNSFYFMIGYKSL